MGQIAASLHSSHAGRETSVFFRAINLVYQGIDVNLKLSTINIKNLLKNHQYALKLSPSCYDNIIEQISCRSSHRPSERRR